MSTHSVYSGQGVDIHYSPVSLCLAMYNGSPPDPASAAARFSRKTAAVARANRERANRNQIKTLDDFSVRTTPSPSPEPSRSSTPDHNKPKLVISSLVAQRFARLTKKLDEEEEMEKQAREERETGRHIRQRGARSVLSMAPSQLARVSVIEVSTHVT